MKANLAPPNRYKHLKRAEEVAMTRLRIGHCKATKGHIVSCGPPAVCHHCSSTLSREHILLQCGTVQELRGKFYKADSLTSLFECVCPLAIIEYMKEAEFCHLIWWVYESDIRNGKSHKPQNPDYHIIEDDKGTADDIRKMCRTANMSWRTCVFVKQTQFHSIPLDCIWLPNSPSYSQTHASPGLEGPHDSTNICRIHRYPWILQISVEWLTQVWERLLMTKSRQPMISRHNARTKLRITVLRKIVPWHQVILTNLPIHHHLNIYLWSKYIILNSHWTTLNFIFLGNLVKSELRNIMNFGWPGIMNWRPQLNSGEGKQMFPRRNAATRCHWLTTIKYLTQRTIRTGCIYEHDDWKRLGESFLRGLQPTVSYSSRLNGRYWPELAAGTQRNLFKLK